MLRVTLLAAALAAASAASASEIAAVQRVEKEIVVKSQNGERSSAFRRRT